MADVDLLGRYRAKRDFSKTAEPRGTAAATGGNRFIVQKHDASRLHWDFRLEMDGVLKSWAVTRGPSLDPAEKRLAVRTEDHPLSYADFEGTIPEGEYGGGTVMLWDSGTWEPVEGKSARDLDKGHLHFRLHGERMKGEWLLIRLKPRGRERGENWLLRKLDDAYAGATDTLTETALTSVASGRTMEEIAEGKPAKSRRKAKAANDPDDPPPRRAKPARSRQKGKLPADPPESDVEISNRDRVIYPEAGITKGQLADYYAAVAPILLPWMANRPISLVRCPQGRAKHCFFQKHDAGSFGPHVHHVDIREKSGAIEPYLYVDDTDGVLACVQMGTIEFHGWGSRVADIEKPDRIVFDLDPDEGLGFEAVRKAAADLKEHLAAMGLASWPMLTGGKGVHVIVPLRPGAEWPAAKSFAERVAKALAEAEPDRFTANLKKAQRSRRIFIDYLRNERGSTAVMPYAARARAGAPVAAPVGWSELREIGEAGHFTVHDAKTLIDRAGSRTLAGWGTADQQLPDL